MLDEQELLFDELYEKTKDCGRTQFIRLLMSKERENKILRENAEHNDKVVDKVNWENRLLKEKLSTLNEMNADNYNKYCEELKKNIELKKQLNELKEIEKDHQRLNGELRKELKKCI